MSLTSGIGSAIAITVNDVVVPGSHVPIVTAPGNAYGSIQVSLAAGDVIKLQNDSSVDMVYALHPAVSTRLTIKRLN